MKRGVQAKRTSQSKAWGISVRFLTKARVTLPLTHQQIKRCFETIVYLLKAEELSTSITSSFRISSSLTPRLLRSIRSQSWMRWRIFNWWWGNSKSSKAWVNNLAIQSYKRRMKWFCRINGITSIRFRTSRVVKTSSAQGQILKDSGGMKMPSMT